MRREVRRPRELWRRYAAATGLREVGELEHRVSSVEVAVHENAHLEGPLEERVAELERLLLRVVEERNGTGRR